LLMGNTVEEPSTATDPDAPLLSPPLAVCPPPHAASASERPTMPDAIAQRLEVLFTSFS
jgi:hypothetical protein